MEEPRPHKTPLREHDLGVGLHNWTWAEDDEEGTRTWSHHLIWYERERAYLDVGRRSTESDKESALVEEKTMPQEVTVLPLAETTVEDARRKAQEYHAASPKDRQKMTMRGAHAYSVALPRAHWHIGSNWRGQDQVFTDPWKALEATLPGMRRQIAEERKDSPEVADHLEGHCRDCQALLDEHKAHPLSGPTPTKAAVLLGWNARYGEGKETRAVVQECRDQDCMELEHKLQQDRKRGMHM